MQAHMEGRLYRAISRVIITSAYLAKAGHKVSILEKNSQTGGRARAFEADGFMFDMGSSWYWMPDTFESFLMLLKKNERQLSTSKIRSGFSSFFRWRRGYSNS